VYYFLLHSTFVLHIHKNFFITFFIMVTNYVQLRILLHITYYGYGFLNKIFYYGF